MPGRIDTSDLLDDICRVYNELGEPPTEAQYDEYGQYSSSVIRSRFGKFTAGREAADIPNPDMRGGQNRIEREELLDAIRELAEEVNGTPTRSQMNEHGRYAKKPYRREFGSWSEALLSAGFDYNELNRPGSQVASTVSVKCTTCGKEETRLKSDLNDIQHPFCSQDCLHKWRREEFTGNDHPLSKQVTVKCDWCGNTFERRPSIVKPREYNFCGPACMGEWRSENRSGENAPAWKGGSGYYRGPNWLAQRERCLNRDDYECQFCGLTEGEHFDKYSRQLEVHHQKPVRVFYEETEDTPDFEEMNRLSNLVTLCVQCHRNEDATV